MPTASAQALDLASLGWLGYLRQPDRFCREMLHSFNDPWQAAALAHLNDPDCTALFIVSCHGTGKTRLASHAIYHAGLAWGSRVRIPCTAPKQQLLAEKLWPELHKVHMGADPVIRDAAEWSKTHLRFFNSPGWEAIAETAKDVEGLAGHHEDRVLFVCEEATGVDEEFWPVILGALSTKGSKLLAISNYTRTSGYFAQRFAENRPGERLMRVAWNPRGVPGVEPKDTTRPYTWRTRNGTAVETWYSDRPETAWAQSIIAEYGWDSTLTRVRVRGLPPLSDVEALVPGEKVWAAWGREVETTTLDPVVWSWDVAGAGRDKSIVAQRRGNLVEAIRDTKQPNVSLAAREIAALADSAKPDQINLDTIGIGTGPADELTADGYHVTRVNVGETQGMPEDVRRKYVRKRAWFYWRLREDFLQERIGISKQVPRDVIEALVQELEATTWKIAPDGRLDIVAKDAIKAAIGRSPDVADALMLHYASAAVGSGEPAILSPAVSANADW